MAKDANFNRNLVNSSILDILLKCWILRPVGDCSQAERLGREAFEEEQEEPGP